MKNSFNPLDHPVCLDLPEWFDETAWAEHIPFAMYLISIVKPKTFVELGTFRGVSYCAFCQVVKKLGTKTKCYAVDTWQGDSQAGYLEETVIEKLRKYHDPLYSNFSTLIQSTFDEALNKFEDKSIDLLHIDGFHTYEAVSHDFNTWLPKISDRGMVLFHDTNVRERDFGVWKFWEEIAKQYPHFEFLHGHGLGVLAVGEKYPEGLKFLFSADEELIQLVRNTFNRFGSAVDSANPKNFSNKEINRLKDFENFVVNSKIVRKLYLMNQVGTINYIKETIGGKSR